MLSDLRVLCFVWFFLLIYLPAVSAIEMNKDFFDKFGIEYRTWFPELAGKVHKGSELDLKSTLGMEDKVSSSLSTVFIGSILSMQNKWRLGYENYNYMGNKTLNDNLNFNSVNFAAGSSIHAEADVKAIKAVLLPTFSKAGDSSFSWLYGAKGISINYSLQNVNTGDKKSTAFNALMPMAGVRFETGRNHTVSYYSEISAAAVNGKNYNLDIEAGFHYKLSRKAIISGGYHTVMFRVKDNEDDARFRLGGAFAQFNYKY